MKGSPHKQDPDTTCDYVVMLLSTDWFFPYWHILGITDSTRKTEVVKDKFRDLVKSIIGCSIQYWYVSFSEGRLKHTRGIFEEIVRASPLNEYSKCSLKSLISANERPKNIKENMFFHDLTREIIANSESILNENVLNKRICDAVAKTWAKCEIDGLDFVRSSTDSLTAWDVYIRSLTPDQPSLLGLYFEISVLIQRGFRTLVIEMQNNIPRRDLVLLQEYYSYRASYELGRAACPGFL